jgi:hypothetical protein
MLCYEVVDAINLFIIKVNLEGLNNIVRVMVSFVHVENVNLRVSIQKSISNR